MNDKAELYRFGFYLDPQPDDPSVVDIHVAESLARKMSVENSGLPVAIWDGNNNTVKLFAGYQDLTPVKL